MEQLNQSAFLLLNGLTGHSHFFDLLVIFCAQYLAYIVVVSTVFYIYFHSNRQRAMKEVLVIACSAVLAYVVASVCKHFYLHDRPFIFFNNIVPLISPDSPHGSFPSGHATFFSALAVAFYFYHRKIASLYVLGAFLIGLSRVIAGVHWPLDILAGYFLGGLIACGVHYVISKRVMHDRFGIILPE